MAGTLVSLEEADISDLPPFARELVGLIGFSATIQLVSLRPGIPFYVPETIHETHWLNELGTQACAVLVKNFSGLTIAPPNCKLALVKIRQRQILRSRDEGYSQTETASLHGVTPRWVSKLENREPEEDRNESLF